MKNYKENIDFVTPRFNDKDIHLRNVALKMMLWKVFDEMKRLNEINPNNDPRDVFIISSRENDNCIETKRGIVFFYPLSLCNDSWVRWFVFNNYLLYKHKYKKGYHHG